MLHTTTVQATTLALLKELMTIPGLQQFSLVGGTALALKYGHRISEDIDLFTEEEFDQASLISLLQDHFGTDYDIEDRMNKVGVFCFIRQIKVDFVKHFHPMIEPREIIEGIRMYGEKDIAAMKVATILTRAKKKDFYDMEALLRRFSLDDIISYYYQKFPSQLLLISIPQAITYFTDVNEDVNPVSLEGKTWSMVKKNIGKVVNEYLK